ncbi:Phosphoribosyl-AMP cyclohydrolase [Catenulispora acidiphila DSM 44928]|uniref:Phosphoribosyl-AMP cyclohydrolase n=1 Tax=Catenulispora acidiphila (strain DSM 44928 / JCM 14897 / NBRC 102108 / NRRL B-24433 / ID139908) TaxID=479433 RepID=C7QCC5_CATAD|nr:phosphoribosyl-AMP cyclohydrolase [Catenulispora acidiphila]ACU74573.1 Phosphoribosyl-AMP cyclohydrolase [Catenulispora acidiphila DSM 44928]
MTDEVATPALAPEIAARLKRDEHGLFAAIAQQHDTGEVLMLAWMDEEALRRTLVSGRVTYWSRSRAEYWTKGDTSGNVQILKSAAVDCDGDAVLLKVDQSGGACHTGDRTCFDAGDLPLGVDAETGASRDESRSAGSASAARGPLGESTA